VNFLPQVKNAKKTLLALCVLLIGTVAFVLFRWAPSYSEDIGEVEIEWILPPRYRSFSHPSEGRIWAQEEDGGPWTLFDVDGTVIKSGVNAESFSKYEYGLAYSHIDEYRDGFFDLSGDMVSSLARKIWRDKIRSEDELLFNVKSLLEDQFRTRSDGLLPTLDYNGLYGFTDIYGKWVISPDYEMVSPFSEGLCVVMKNGKYGYINRSGDVVLDFTFKGGFSFAHGMAVVGTDSERYGVINKEGRWIAEPVYETFGTPWGELLALQKDGKIGFIDSSGNVTIDFKFLGIKDIVGMIRNDYCFSEGFATVFDDEKRGRRVINKSGDILFDVGKEGEFIQPFNGGFMCAYDSTSGITILFDRNGRRYSLPRDMRTRGAHVMSMSEGFYTFFESGFLDDSGKKSGCFIIKGAKGDGADAKQ
jgi:hypothetical protein